MKEISYPYERTLTKVGNSLGLLVPSELLKAWNITADTQILIDYNANLGQVSIFLKIPTKGEAAYEKIEEQRSLYTIPSFLHLPTVQKAIEYIKAYQGKGGIMWVNLVNTLGKSAIERVIAFQKHYLKTGNLFLKDMRYYWDDHGIQVSLAKVQELTEAEETALAFKLEREKRLLDEEAQNQLDEQMAAEMTETEKKIEEERKKVEAFDKKFEGEE